MMAGHSRQSMRSAFGFSQCTGVIRLLSRPQDGRFRIEENIVLRSDWLIDTQ